ncbi:MAG: homocysteine S-methyltransferase family protein [Gammaproteobacteria bacterium]|nr:homocysteine S-methyltransferase family protein [Gammaproteobacteria bacterium]
MTPGELTARLDAELVICAEGYLFELERRGYLQAGPFVPEVVLEHPEVVRQLHHDFVHAGSDVVEALTYYAHRGQLRVVGREADVERMNRQALAIAREVADATSTLLAGNVCNTNVYDPDDAASVAAARAMFDEQIAWAVEAGVDYIVGETFTWLGEARLALDAILDAGQAAVITLAVPREGVLWDGFSPEAACAALAAQGATVVGVNCFRGPATMLPIVERVRARVDCHVAALPVPYRTSAAEPTFQSLTDPDCDCVPDRRPFPTALDPLRCNRYEIAAFATAAAALGVQYLGVCCGGGPDHIRAIAEALGRAPRAARYSPDMSRHAYFGADAGSSRPL